MIDAFCVDINRIKGRNIERDWLDSSVLVIQFDSYSLEVT